MVSFPSPTTMTEEEMNCSQGSASMMCSSDVNSNDTSLYEKSNVCVDSPMSNESNATFCGGHDVIQTEQEFPDAIGNCTTSSISKGVEGQAETKAAKFKCNKDSECEAAFTSRNALTKHVKAVHSYSKCPLCEFTCKSNMMQARHAIFAHSLIRVKKNGEEEDQNPGLQNMVFHCFLDDCNWIAGSEDWMMLHIMYHHMYADIGGDRINLKNYKFHLQGGLESYDHWSFLTCDGTLPSGISSSFKSILYVVRGWKTHPSFSHLIAPQSSINDANVSSENSKKPKPKKGSKNQSKVNYLPAPVSGTSHGNSPPPPGFTTMSSDGEANQAQEDCNRNSSLKLTTQSSISSMPPYSSSLLTPRQVLSCSYCPMRSDVAREVALHEVRYHCRRILYGQDLLFICYVPTCGWKCLREEYLVLHILSFHRNTYINKYEKEELYQANLFNLTYLARLDLARNSESCGVEQIPYLPYHPSVETSRDGEIMHSGSSSNNSSNSDIHAEMAKVPKRKNSQSKLLPKSKRAPSSKKYELVACQMDALGNDSGSDANSLLSYPSSFPSSYSQDSLNQANKPSELSNLERPDKNQSTAMYGPGETKKGRFVMDLL